MIDAGLEREILAGLRSHTPADRDGALRSLGKAMYRPLLGLCSRMTGDVHAAEDAVQETFVQVLHGVDRFRGEARLSTWIFRIAIRAATRVRQRAQRHDHAPLEHEPRATGADPAARAVENEGADRILAALDRLPDKHRAVLALAALQGLEHSEIAEVLGVPEGTVHSRVHHARTKLEAILSRDD